MAETFAESQFMRTSPSAKVIRKFSVRIRANSSAKSFRIRAGIMSRLDALLGLIFFSSLRTPSLLICMSDGHGMFTISSQVNVDCVDCVAAVERLPALHYSVDFIFLSFGILDFIVEL